MKQDELLQQIAIDVAVIKSEIQEIKELREDVKENTDDITKLKTQMNTVKWVGSSAILGIISWLVSKLTGLFT